MAARPTLIIGNRNYSSWSLRPWLFMQSSGIDFVTEMVPLQTERFAERVGALSPTHKVPLLLDGAIKVWDSLAICECVREQYKVADAWPRQPEARAVARSVVAEMHSGFAALRNAMPMNLRRTPQALPAVADDVHQDIARIIALWQDCRERFGAEGEGLFGRFGIADAFFAPVAMRFHSYAVALEGSAQAYADYLRNLPAMREWRDAANAEVERIDKYETSVAHA